MKFILAILVFSLSAFAQSVSPVITECGKKCSDEYTVTNLGIHPMTVTIEVKVLKFVEGKATYYNPDASVQVDMSEMSARVAAHDSHTFGYKIHCDVLPCAVNIWNVFTTGKPQANGMLMRLAVPHVTWVCAKENDCRKKSLAASGVKE